MAMQRAQFQMIADVIKAERTRNGAVDGFSTSLDSHRLADRFADALADTNPRFDRARFLTACGVQ